MSHTTVTQSQPIPMPRHSGLLERKGRFYLNMRVPRELRSLYGKKEIIRKSLDTSDRSEAISRVRYEAFKLDAEFAERRRELKTAEAPTAIREISDGDAHNLVFNWFISLEKLSQEWCDKLNDDSVEDVLDNLRTDEVVFSGGSKDYRGEEADTDLDAFLKSAGLECPKGSAAYNKLLPLFTKARLENVRRTMARVTHQTISPREPLFQNVHAHTPPPHQIATVAKMVESFLKQVKIRCSKKTYTTYEVPCRLLKELFGKNTPVANIQRKDIERLFTLFRNIPTNAHKRYRGLTLQEATALADKNNDPRRLSAKSLENYRINVNAIFNYAVELDMLPKNPATGRHLKALLVKDEEHHQKPQFTIDELNKLFRAPIFSLNDNSAIKTLRQGKAWLPLLALFHGFRANEVAQLYTEDVKTEDGIHYIHIRKAREDGSKSEKRLKTKQSNRRIPLHSEILKMGFLSFVAQRRNDTDNPMLFTDLTPGATGYFSDAFSKWFGRFKKKTLGSDCKATFHSFRHMFKDALVEADVSADDRESLGGWGLKLHSSEHDYGHGPSLKRLHLKIQKVEYPKLDLTHLYTNH